MNYRTNYIQIILKLILSLNYKSLQNYLAEEYALLSPSESP